MAKVRWPHGERGGVLMTTSESEVTLQVSFTGKGEVVKGGDRQQEAAITTFSKT